MPTYCTIADAKDAGATGTDAEITAAIERASARVDRYCGDVFAPTVLTVRAQISNRGVALLPRRLRTVTAVRYAGLTTTLPVDAFTVRSSGTVVGSIDAIVLSGTRGWSDVTVLGAEPWAGGWAGLSRATGTDDNALDVTGEFGWAAAPGDVVEATALIATWLRGNDRTPAGLPVLDAAGTDTEGNVLPVVPGKVRDRAQVALAVDVHRTTTGVIAADALLAPYVRQPVRFG